MRKRQTFLLTILSAENGTRSFCGRMKVISSGKTCTFTTLEELYNLISAEMDDESLQNFAAGDYPPAPKETPRAL